ncbi:MAG: hypothetical protein ACXVLQ_00010 [Bacteriovorax sp.]
MKNIFLVSLIFLTFSNGASARDRLNESLLVEYLKLQKEFSDESCKPGTEEDFLRLDKNYRGDGNFIPVLLDEKVDLKTVKNLLPLIKDKSAWISAQMEFIKKNDDFKNLKLEIERLEDSVAGLQELKKDYFFAGDLKKKEEIKKKAAVLFEGLLKNLDQFKNKVPFLLSFKFPTNHLSLRAEYDKYKNINTKEARARANAIYLFRKIVQDGSNDEDMTRNDSVIRSAFDTLYLSLIKDKQRDFLTDNERVDFKYVLNNFDKLLSMRPEKLIERFTEWKNRNDRALIFYQDLIEGKKIKLSEDSQIKDVTSLLEERAKSLYTLKEFALTREARAYEYWSKKSELLQSLYAIETILYSEVGRMDAPDALERRDVAQVVINRFENADYNSLTDKDTITKFLSPQIKVQDNKWLNVLFKEGEFSFTYFYFPGNFHIYCPDMSRTGQFLRRENVRIALELLNRPKNSSSALRYFSRMSMFGRIEMDSLWSDFKPLPEVPGLPVRNPNKLYKLFKKDRYKFLYDFANEELKKRFLVVELKGKTYVVDAKDTRQIYNYRNPHQFKYFTR